MKHIWIIAFVACTACNGAQEEAQPKKLIKVAAPEGVFEVATEMVDGHLIAEGDIAVKEAPGGLFAAMSTGSTSKLWPGGVVYYSIDPNMPNKDRVTAAIAVWEKTTSIRFKPRTTQPDYVMVYDGTGCWSYIGRQGGKQLLSLDSNCSTGNAIHEFGHALGFWHEHTRSDRDSFVKIHWENIPSASESQFAKQGAASTRNHSPYDFESIMHYGPYAFSSNGRPTISRLDGKSTAGMGQRKYLSFGDIQGVQKLYPVATPSPSPSPSATPACRCP